MQDTNTDRTTVLITAIVALAIAAVLLGIAFAVGRNSLANTASDKQLGSQCISAGGSWVRGQTGYQCIAGK